MNRLLMLVGVAVVAAAMYVAASPASQQSKGVTAKQFNALKKTVTAQGKTLKAVKTLALAEGQLLVDCSNQGAIAVGQFGDPVNKTGGYIYSTDGTTATNSSFTLETALDAADPTDPNAVFFLGGDSTCGTDVNGSLRHAAARAGLTFVHAAAHRPSWVAHRP
jgi:hypothetical protein